MKLAALGAALLVVACDKGPADGGELEYVTKEVTKLEAAFAASDEVRILTGCVSVTASKPPASLAAKIEQLCYVDAPRFHFTRALAEVKQAPADMPRDLACMQLMVSDAFKAMEKKTPPDPAVKTLADEYTQLCPDAVAKIRARANSKPTP